MPERWWMCSEAATLFASQSQGELGDDWCRGQLGQPHYEADE